GGHAGRPRVRVRRGLLRGLHVAGRLRRLPGEPGAPGGVRQVDPPPALAARPRRARQAAVSAMKAGWLLPLLVGAPARSRGPGVPWPACDEKEIEWLIVTRCNEPDDYYVRKVEWLEPGKWNGGCPPPAAACDGIKAFYCDDSVTCACYRWHKGA